MNGKLVKQLPSFGQKKHIKPPNCNTQKTITLKNTQIEKPSNGGNLEL